MRKAVISRLRSSGIAVAGLCVAALMAVSVAAPASAVTARVGAQRQAAQESRSAAPSAAPRESQDLSFDIACASWKGELAWGGNGNPIIPAYIDVSGLLKSPCSDGHAQLHIHYDTIDNPKNIEIKAIGPDSVHRTPWDTKDSINTFKDIYLWICSWRGTVHHEKDYSCSHHKGPGA
jgi:hypothetical protein